MGGRCQVRVGQGRLCRKVPIAQQYSTTKNGIHSALCFAGSIHIPKLKARVSTIQKNAVEAFFVAGYDFIVGDVAQESPHGLIVHWNGKTEEDAWSARRRIEPPLAFLSPAATAVG